MLLPAEPRKVGIVLDNPSLLVKKVTDPEDADRHLRVRPHRDRSGDPRRRPPDADASRHRARPRPTRGPTSTPAAQYQLTETPQADWQTGTFTCVDVSNDDAPVAITADGLITLPPGSDVVCTLTNTKRPTISVHKVTEGGNGTFGFTLSGPPGFDPQTKNVTTDLGAGDASFDPPFSAGATYTMVETTAPGGWISKFVECTGTERLRGRGRSTASPGSSSLRRRVERSVHLREHEAADRRGAEVEHRRQRDVRLHARGCRRRHWWEHARRSTRVPAAPRAYTWDSGLTPGGTYDLTRDPKTGWVSTFVGLHRHRR